MVAASSKKLVAEVSRQIGEKEKAICLLSGGVDTGLTPHVAGATFVSHFRKYLRIPVQHMRRRAIFLRNLKGITDPKKKRKVIGETYLRLMDVQAQKDEQIKYWMQGTIFPEVGDFPERDKKIEFMHMFPQKSKLEIVRPLAGLSTQKIVQLGRELGLPAEILKMQSIPGTGLAIRILGEVTGERLDKLRAIDWILAEELRLGGVRREDLLVFGILTGFQTPRIVEGKRKKGEVVAVRIVQSDDQKVASWEAIPIASICV